MNAAAVQTVRVSTVGGRFVSSIAGSTNNTLFILHSLRSVERDWHMLRLRAPFRGKQTGTGSIP